MVSWKIFDIFIFTSIKTLLNPMWKLPHDTQNVEPIDIQDLASWLDACNLQLPAQDLSISMGERRVNKFVYNLVKTSDVCFSTLVHVSSGECNQLVDDALSWFGASLRLLYCRSLHLSMVCYYCTKPFDIKNNLFGNFFDTCHIHNDEDPIKSYVKINISHSKYWTRWHRPTRMASMETILFHKTTKFTVVFIYIKQGYIWELFIYKFVKIYFRNKIENATIRFKTTQGLSVFKIFLADLDACDLQLPDWKSSTWFTRKEKG